jgi:ribosomal protein S6--L-glutamate ligase
MRLAILAAPESWYARDLARAAGGRHEVVILPFDRLAARVTAEGIDVITGGVSLAEFDAVLVRTMPPGSLEQVVFRMDCLGRLEAGGTLVVNPPRAIEAAVDKFLTTARLQAAGLPTPATLACQTVDEAIAGFETLGGDVVVKPLFGSEGRGIARLTDPALAQRAFTMLTQLGAVLYLQPFIPHEGFDLRLLLLGEDMLAIRRVSTSDWRTNLSRGARAEPLVPDDALVSLARRAAEAVGAPLAGVDLLPGRDGQVYVLEVNAVPGWKGLARAWQSDVSRRVIDWLAARCRR